MKLLHLKEIPIAITQMKGRVLSEAEQAVSVRKIRNEWSKDSEHFFLYKPNWTYVVNLIQKRIKDPIISPELLDAIEWAEHNRLEERQEWMDAKRIFRAAERKKVHAAWSIVRKSFL